MKTFTKCKKQKVYSEVFHVTFFAFRALFFIFHTRVGICAKSQRIFLKETRNLNEMWKCIVKPATDDSRDSCKHVSWLSHEKKLRCMRITYTSFAVRTIFSLNIFLRENPFDFIILQLLAWNSSKCETREICLMKWPQQCE